MSLCLLSRKREEEERLNECRLAHGMKSVCCDFEDRIPRRVASGTPPLCSRTISRTLLSERTRKTRGILRGRHVLRVSQPIHPRVHPVSVFVLLRRIAECSMITLMDYG